MEVGLTTNPSQAGNLPIHSLVSGVSFQVTLLYIQHLGQVLLVLLNTAPSHQIKSARSILLDHNLLRLLSWQNYDKQTYRAGYHFDSAPVSTISNDTALGKRGSRRFRLASPLGSIWLTAFKGFRNLLKAKWRHGEKNNSMSRILRVDTRGKIQNMLEVTYYCMYRVPRRVIYTLGLALDSSSDPRVHWFTRFM